MPPDSRWKAPRSRGIRQKNNEKTAAARESAAAVFSYKSLNLEQRGACQQHRPRPASSASPMSSPLVTMMAVAVGWPAARMASRSTFSSGVPALTLSPTLTSALKPLTLHLHGVHADMDQHLDAVARWSCPRRAGWKPPGSTVPSNGAYTVSPVGSMPQPGPRMPCAKVSSGMSACASTLPRHAASGSVLLWLENLAGVFLLGLAAEQLVKKSHGECTFLLNHCYRKRQGELSDRNLPLPKTIPSIPKRYHIILQKIAIDILHKLGSKSSVRSHQGKQLLPSPSMRVAQLVAMRITVWVSSYFSQKPNFALPFQRSQLGCFPAWGTPGWWANP